MKSESVTNRFVNKKGGKFHPFFISVAEFSRLKLIHRIVFARCFQCGITGKVFFVIVAHIGTGHVLVSDTSDTLANLLALYVQYVAQHALITKVISEEVVGR